jgi:hypothetical protein
MAAGRAPLSAISSAAFRVSCDGEAVARINVVPFRGLVRPRKGPPGHWVITPRIVATWGDQSPAHKRKKPLPLDAQDPLERP